MYDRNQSTYGQSPRLLPLRKKGSVYSTGLVRVSSDKISFAVGAVDRFTGTPNPNGIYSARVMLDGQEISGFTLDNISYEDTRYINAQLDFPYKSKGGSALQHISALPAATDVDYFNELKTKGADAMKEYMPKVEEFFENLFKGGNKTTNTTTTGTPSAN